MKNSTDMNKKYTWIESNKLYQMQDASPTTLTDIWNTDCIFCNHLGHNRRGGHQHN